MLTKGFKDTQQKRMDQILKAGLQLEFVPDLWEREERRKLDTILEQALSMSLDEIESRSAEQLLAKLKGLDLSFSNLENFADLLIKTISAEPEKQSSLAQKAVALYEYAQNENKTFSIGLIQKIKVAKEKI